MKNQTVIAWNNHLAAQGWTSLFLFAMLVLLLNISIGLSVLVTLPLMRLSYGELFKIIF